MPEDVRESDLNFQYRYDLSPQYWDAHRLWLHILSLMGDDASQLFAEWEKDVAADQQHIKFLAVQVLSWQKYISKNEEPCSVDLSGIFQAQMDFFVKEVTAGSKTFNSLTEALNAYALWRQKKYAAPERVEAAGAAGPVKLAEVGEVAEAPAPLESADSDTGELETLLSYLMVFARTEDCFVLCEEWIKVYPARKKEMLYLSAFLSMVKNISDDEYSLLTQFFISHVRSKNDKMVRVVKAFKTLVEWSEFRPELSASEPDEPVTVAAETRAAATAVSPTLSEEAPISMPAAAPVVSAVSAASPETAAAAAPAVSPAAPPTPHPVYVPSLFGPPIEPEEWSPGFFERARRLSSKLTIIAAWHGAGSIAGRAWRSRGKVVDALRSAGLFVHRISQEIYRRKKIFRPLMAAGALGFGTIAYNAGKNVGEHKSDHAKPALSSSTAVPSALAPQPTASASASAPSPKPSSSSSARQKSHPAPSPSKPR